MAGEQLAFDLHFEGRRVWNLIKNPRNRVDRRGLFNDLMELCDRYEVDITINHYPDILKDEDCEKYLEKDCDGNYTMRYEFNLRIPCGS